MKLTFLHGIFLASILVGMKKIIYHYPPSFAGISKTEPRTPRRPKAPNFTWKPNFSNWNIEPPEPFIAAYSKPSSPLKERTPLNSQQKLIETIKDYTVKIIFTGPTKSNSGTGWFLDYEIPVYPKKYPTRWFIATNAHVVDEYPFHADPYDQKPKTRSTAYGTHDLYLYRWESGGYDEEIMREKGIDYEDPTFWSSEGAKKYNPHLNKLPPSRDVLTTKKHWHRNKETPSMHIRIPEPKLLYAALDELEYSGGEIANYYLDFAVMEINFPTEESAKRMTHQVYYKPESERIKIFGKVNENSQFYTAGYPGNSYNKFRPVGNYSFTQKRASNKRLCHPLSNGPITIQKWNGKDYKSNRCYHELDFMYAGKGSSGSMVVDESGTLLGLNSRGNDESPYGYIQPIRDKTKTCYYPSCKEQLEYDLIVGSQFQRTSYKQQLLTYLPHIDTYLKNKHKWDPTPPTVEI